MTFDRIDIRILEVIQENGDFNDAEVRVAWTFPRRRFGGASPRSKSPA
jgi:hypothetical protein